MNPFEKIIDDLDNCISFDMIPSEDRIEAAKLCEAECDKLMGEFAEWLATNFVPSTSDDDGMYFMPYSELFRTGIERKEFLTAHLLQQFKEGRG